MKKKEEEKVILYDSPEAAKFVTGISGWVDSDGRFWGKDEDMARYSGCTHKVCSCGNQMEKYYLKCSECRAKDATERYNALPAKEWDGKEYLYSHVADKYFFTQEDLEEYCADEKDNPNDLRLVFCDPNYLNEVELQGELPEDYDYEDVVSQEIRDMVKALNKKISEHKAISYEPGKVRAIVNMDNFKTYNDEE